MTQDPKALEDQVAGTGDAGNPPLDQWNPALCGDIDIRIARNGEWFFKNEKMQRQALVKLFTSILRREDDGHYYLVTPAEKWRIQVEDTPLLAHSVEVTGEGRGQNVDVTTNVGETLRIGRAHPLHLGTYAETGEPRPIIRVRQGLEARLVTAAFYDLAGYVTEKTIEDRDVLGVWSDGIFFELGEGG
ncbi:MAG: DUF1285 domain-containing protein [Oleiphilaceae bacterium]|nr:DUF1285 domain-containing protein [Oleiphilaceae bacterium]